MISHVLNLLYYTLAETMAINETFANIMIKLVAKARDNKNKHKQQ